MPKLGKSQAKQNKFTFTKMFCDSFYLIEEINVFNDLEYIGFIISTTTLFKFTFLAYLEGR